MPLPLLHVITDDEVLLRRDMSRDGRRVLAAGGPRLALHLRGPRTPGARLYALARDLLGPARDAGALLFMNDRVDVAMAASLDGVHLGERSLPVPTARALLGPLWIGRSAHGGAGVSEASERGADFIVAGTVFASASHPGREAAGVAALRGWRRLTPLPLLAIGGVTRQRVADVTAAGADGVAVLSGIWQAAEEPAGAVEGYLEALARTGAS